MIKPTDVTAPTALLSQQEEKQLQDLEGQFDAAIRQASHTGRWPATVQRFRDGISASLVSRVAAKYRAAGWVVAENGVNRAEIAHPEAK